MKQKFLSEIEIEPRAKARHEVETRSQKKRMPTQKRAKAKFLTMLVPFLASCVFISCLTTNEAEKALSGGNSNANSVNAAEEAPLAPLNQQDTAGGEQSPLGVVSQEELDANVQAIDDTVAELAPAAVSPEPESPQTKTSSVETNPALIANSALEMSVRRALARGQYIQALRLTENAVEEKLVYYRGIAYFVLSLNVAEYNEEERAVYTGNAEVFFERVAKNFNYSDRIRSKALFWHAMAIETVSLKSSEKRRALALLETLRKRYPDSPVYSDSLFYSATMHYQLTEFEASNTLFQQLSRYRSENDTQVYDRITKKYFRQSEAAKLGMARQKRYRRLYSLK